MKQNEEHSRKQRRCIHVGRENSVKWAGAGEGELTEEQTEPLSAHIYDQNNDCTCIQMACIQR